MQDTRTTSGFASTDTQVTGLRVIAFLLDSVIVVVAGVIFGLLVMGLFGGSLSNTFTTGYSLAALFYLIELIFVQGATGWTLGKKLAGIRVIREDTGNAPGAGKAFFRTLLLIVDGLFFNLVGFFVIVLSGKNQRLGDMAASTLVVRASPSRVQ